ncbi:MAG: hypothetical protein U5L96_07840 [Owenweeksia sp.]|nr:hypothetical protein [Owenweeksia sp.]
MHLAIGHSLGGMALFNAQYRLPDYFKKIVVIGTPANVHNVVFDFARVVKASEKVAHGIINRIEKDFELNIAEVSTDYLAAVSNPPGLLSMMNRTGMWILKMRTNWPLNGQPHSSTKPQGWAIAEY